MAFVSDTFTDTDGVLLAAHSGEAGAAWTKHPSYSGTMQTISNQLRPTNTTTTAYYASGVPATAEYDVQADITQVTSVNQNPGILGRVDSAANTFYMVRFSTSASAWQLYQFVNGTATLLGSFTDTFSAGVTKTVKLQIRNATKKAFINGTERISSTDNTITAAGFAGVRDTVGSSISDTTGYRFDNFIAADIPDVPPTVSITIAANTAWKDTIQATANATANTGSIASYAWSIVAAPSGSSAVLSGTATASVTLQPDKVGVYTFSCLVTDTLGGSTAASGTTTVRPTTWVNVAGTATPAQVWVSNASGTPV